MIASPEHERNFKVGQQVWTYEHGESTETSVIWGLCLKCRGTGVLKRWHRMGMRISKCPTCDGSGRTKHEITVPIYTVELVGPLTIEWIGDEKPIAAAGNDLWKFPHKGGWRKPLWALYASPERAIEYGCREINGHYGPQLRSRFVEAVEGVIGT